MINFLKAREQMGQTDEEAKKARKQAELAETQHQAAEFSDAQIEGGVPFDPGLSTEHADHVGQMIEPGVPTVVESKPGTHRQAGIELENEIPIEKRIERLQALMDSDKTGPAMMEGLLDARGESEQKKAA